MSSWLRQEQGISVIEALLAAALGLIVVSAGMGVLFTSMRTWQRGEADTQVQSALRLAVDQIERDLRAARRISAGSGTSISVVVPKRCGDGSTTGTVTCNSPGITARDFDFRQNASGGYFVPDGRTVTYTLSGTQLVRTVSGVAGSIARTPVAQCGSTPLFAYNNATPASADVVIVTLCGTAQRRGGVISSTSQVRVELQLRNRSLPSSHAPALRAAVSGAAL